MSDESDLRGDAPGRRPFDSITEERLVIAIAKAMKEVLTDEEVLERMGGIAITIIQKRAASSTGNFLLGILKAFFTRWIVILVLAIVLAQMIGIPAALRTLAPVISKGGQP